jgi:hypothetical protein
MRDDKVAENLRAAATQYFVRALEVECTVERVDCSPVH